MAKATNSNDVIFKIEINTDRYCPRDSRISVMATRQRADSRHYQPGIIFKGAEIPADIAEHIAERVDIEYAPMWERAGNNIEARIKASAQLDRIRLQLKSELYAIQ